MSLTTPPAFHQLLMQLISSTDRSQSALTLAEALGGQELVLFMPDPELGMLLPVPGFPQTLSGGRLWREYLQGVADGTATRATLPSPYTGEVVPVFAITAETGIALALLGGTPRESLLSELKNLLPLAGQTLEKEQQLRLVNAQLQQIRSEVANARVLTTALDQLRRELEQALQSASRETAAAEAAKKEVVKTNEELALARDQALAASHSKGAFLSNMSHELRTPLTAIIGYSEILEEDLVEVGARQDLQRIHDAGKHLLALVNDILDMAKIEAGQVDLYPEAFSAEEVVNEAMEIATPQMASNNNVGAVDIAPGVPTLFTDRNKLRQILLNLLSNAAKFTSNGTVTAAASFNTSTGMVTFSVTDTGIGISAESLPKLFTEFSQLNDSSTKTFPGTGLGLAISKRLCQLFGGEITVKSKPGEGSTFRVIIPPRLPPENQKHSSSTAKNLTSEIP